MGFSGERYKSPPGRDYYVEVWDDISNYRVRISSHERFDPAVAAFNKIIKVPREDKPQLRVVMRHRAHVYREWLPERLRDPNKTYDYD